MSLTNWEELGWIEVDAAGVAFCREGRWPKGIDSESTRVLEDGVVYQATMEDCPLPVEVCRDDIGVIVAARMCFTNDVDVIEGTWIYVGQLDFADGLCIACDPYCNGDQYRLTLQMKPGQYICKAFEHSMSEGTVDVLGLSITWAKPINGKGIKMPRWSNQFRPQIQRVEGWFVGSEYARSNSLLSGYYTRPFTGASFDRLAGQGNRDTIGPSDLAAIRKLSIHPSQQFQALLSVAAFQAAVNIPLRRIPVGLNLEGISQRDFDKLLEPNSPGWDLWEILAANLRASRTREFNVGASKLASAKRPTLIPIEDSFVRRILRVNRYDMWRVIYELVNDPNIQGALVRLRRGVPQARSVPLHRILDVVAWRRAQT